MISRPSLSSRMYVHFRDQASDGSYATLTLTLYQREWRTALDGGELGARAAGAAEAIGERD